MDVDDRAGQDKARMAPVESGAPEGPSRLRTWLCQPLDSLARVLSRESEGILVIRGVACGCGEGARVFSIELNEEEGVAALTCRKCRRTIRLYERSLAWGLPRKEGEQPKVFPYKCSCGGHAFQVAVGMEYPRDRVSDEDMLQFSIAAACLACDEISVAFDDEGD
ncbi:MAG: hypothetical protein N3A38_06280 [Planctomycetota bacterium]|nr:hypothetical protein [Planctomycetota bacterium]